MTHQGNQKWWFPFKENGLEINSSTISRIMLLPSREENFKLTWGSLWLWEGPGEPATPSAAFLADPNYWKKKRKKPFPVSWQKQEMGFFLFGGRGRAVISSICHGYPIPLPNLYRHPWVDLPQIQVDTLGSVVWQSSITVPSQPIECSRADTTAHNFPVGGQIET